MKTDTARKVVGIPSQPSPKTVGVRVRVSEEEKAYFEKLASALGLKVQDLIRQLLNAELDKLREKKRDQRAQAIRDRLVHKTP